MKIKVLLYENNPVLRSSLSILITQSPQLTLSAAKSNCQHILQDIQKQSPDIILMDSDLPISDCLNSIQTLKKGYIEAPVVMLAVTEESDYLLKAMLYGASGYLLKHNILRDLVSVIQDTLTVPVRLPPMLANKILKYYNYPSKQSSLFQLSKIEIRILNYINDRNSFSKIANGLSISFSDLLNHIKNIYTKLGVIDQTEALRKLNYTQSSSN